MQRRALCYYARAVGGQVPRLVYGNDAGLANNLSGRRSLRRLRRSAGRQDFDDGTVASAREVNVDGFTLVGSRLDPVFLSHIRARYEELIDDPDASVDLGMHPRPDAVRHVIDPVGNIPEIARLLTEPVAQVVRAAFDTEFKVTSVRLWRTIHVPDADLQRRGRTGQWRPVSVMANLFHNDEHPVSSLKYFVQLTPNMRVDTGALQLFPINMTKRIVRRGFVRPDAVLAPARRLLDHAEQAIVFDGPPGTGLLCNPQRCLHRANIPAPGYERAMLQFALMPSASPSSAHWADLMPPDRDVQRA